MRSDIRARARAAKRQAFVAAARAVVDADGPQAFTMQRVADELDCGVGSIYRYFRSKDDLLAAVHAAQVAVLAAALDGRAAAADDPLARLLGLGRAWVRAGRTHRAEVRAVRGLLIAQQPLAAAVVGPFVAALDAAVAAGRLRPGPAPARARVLLAALGDAALVADDDGLGDQLLTCLLAAWGAEVPS